MPSFQLPVDHAAREVARLRELRSYEMLDTPREAVFDDITNLAAHLCGCPISLISLVDKDRLWFKAGTGLSASEVPRTVALCCDAIWADDDVFIVRDTHRDHRCKDHALVMQPPHIRFYAAAPLRMPGGHVLGTLCVIDHQPRLLTTPQRKGLRALAGQVIAQLELKRTVAELRRAALGWIDSEAALRKSEERFQHFMDHGPALAFIKDDEGRYVYVNQRLAQRFERPVTGWIGRTDADIFGEAQARHLVEHDLKVLNEERPYTFEETVSTPDGQTRCWLSHKFPLRDGGRRQVGGLSLDLTARKQSEQDRERLVGELQQALMQVKTLSGFLPICASCKNVRTDAGYWQKIESYLFEHSGVEFSHGICPVCLEKLYPEFAASQRKE